MYITMQVRKIISVTPTMFLALNLCCDHWYKNNEIEGVIWFTARAFSFLSSFLIYKVSPFYLCTHGLQLCIVECKICTEKNYQTNNLLHFLCIYYQVFKFNCQNSECENHWTKHPGCPDMSNRSCVSEEERRRVCDIQNISRGIFEHILLICLCKIEKSIFISISSENMP